MTSLEVLCCYIEGKKSASFSVEQGVAQGCSLFNINFFNDLLKEANLGIQRSSGKKVGGLLFADDFVGVCNSAESLYIWELTLLAMELGIVM